MKSLIRRLVLLLIVLLALPQLQAQIDVRIEPVRRSHLIGEPVIMNLYLRNNTDSTVVLSNTRGRPWLHLDVTSKLHPRGVPRLVLAKFPSVTIASGKTVAFKLDIAPAFRFDKSGTYSLTATLRMPDRRTTYNSQLCTFNFNEGHSFKKFNITNRKRDIELHAKTLNIKNSPAIFGQAIDKNSGAVLNACYLGKYISYMKPIFLLDNRQHMHIFFQSTPKFFLYAVVAPNGKKTVHEVYVRAGGPIDLIAHKGKIIVTGAIPYKAPTAEKSRVRSATDRPF